MRIRVALLLALSTLLQAIACEKARDTGGEKQMGPSPAMGSGSSAPHDGGERTSVAEAGHTGPR
jgi:hypothetical protein